MEYMENETDREEILARIPIDKLMVVAAAICFCFAFFCILIANLMAEPDAPLDPVQECAKHLNMESAFCEELAKNL